MTLPNHGTRIHHHLLSCRGIFDCCVRRSESSSCRIDEIRHLTISAHIHFNPTLKKSPTPWMNQSHPPPTDLATGSINAVIKSGGQRFVRRRLAVAFAPGGSASGDSKRGIMMSSPCRHHWHDMIGLGSTNPTDHKAEFLPRLPKCLRSNAESWKLLTLLRHEAFLPSNILFEYHQYYSSVMGD